MIFFKFLRHVKIYEKVIFENILVKIYINNEVTAVGELHNELYWSKFTTMNTNEIKASYNRDERLTMSKLILIPSISD